MCRKRFFCRLMFAARQAGHRGRAKCDRASVYLRQADMICWAEHADMGVRMPAGMLRAIAVAAVCVFSGAFAVANERPRHAPLPIQGSAAASRSADTPNAYQRTASSKRNAARTRAIERDPYADPAAPYKANRLSWSRGEPVLNVPGQTTVLTRQVLDDMNATTLRDAMRSTAGVTIGR